MKLTEGMIQKQIVDYLTLRNDLFFQRTNNVGIYDPKKRFIGNFLQGRKRGFLTF